MKITRTNKKIPILLLYLIISSCFVWTCNSQKNRASRWDFDGDFEALKNYDNEGAFPERTLCSSSNSVEDCEDERDGFTYNMQLRKRQPGHNAAALSSAFTGGKTDKSIRTVPVYQSNQASSCSCEVEHRLLDLGILYYPRYVPTAVCKGGCHGGAYRCHPRHYKVGVLKQKQLQEADRMEANPLILPEVLKELFMSETVTVTVACECAP